MKDKPKLMFAGGRTQTRKTHLIAAAAAMARAMKVPTVVVTSSCPNRDNLTKKIRQALGQSSSIVKVAALKDGSAFSEALASWGVVVCAATPAQMSGMLVPLLKQLAGDKVWILVNDEADAQLRSADQDTQLEQSLEELRGGAASGADGSGRVRPPAVELQLSATLLPVMSTSRGEDVCCRDIFLTHMPNDYVDISSFRERMCLEPGELNRAKYYFSATCKEFLDKACAVPGSSVVYIANPFVNAPGGMHQLADRLRGMYPNLTTVVYGGKKVMAHFPKAFKLQEDRYECYLKKGIDEADVKEDIVRLVEKASPGAPVVHLGYRPKFRGFTFSSHASRRPVTHVVAALGDFSLDELVQALGRGTGNVRGMLGDRPVQVLTYRDDLLAAQRYYAFEEHVVALMQRHDLTLGHVLRMQHPACLDMRVSLKKDGQPRCIGQKRAHVPQPVFAAASAAAAGPAPGLPAAKKPRTGC